MTTRRILVLLLTFFVALAPVAAQAPTGELAGRATDEAKKPYSNYSVQLRDVATGTVTATQVLDQQGLFSFKELPASRAFLVELVNIEANRVICSEGPYTLRTPDNLLKNDVNIDCGAVPAIWWLLLAGAGTATVIGTTVASGSR